MPPDAPADDQHREMLARYNQGFTEFIPHNAALGLRLMDFGPGLAWMRLPYAEKLVGNTETRVLHGGAISSLLDGTCGVAVFMKMGSPSPIATLDLRIDYLRPATPDQDVTCKAECFKITRHVAFVRALAFHEDEADPIAAASGSFMIFQKPLGSRAKGQP
jgi:uncharacterized protein (TIGR00369 family)